MSDLRPRDDQPFDSFDDFVAGWLLAWKSVIDAGAVPPDVAWLDAPPELKARLTRGVDCLRVLRSAWPAPSTRTAVALSAGVVLANRFAVLHELGRGGFGIVYRAHDRVLNREVAVKVPRPELMDPDGGWRRFAVEAEATARLDHPNIVTVFDAGMDADTPFIATEYCPGLPLSEWLRQTDGPVPWRDGVSLVGVIAAAVHHAHSRGVLHRDLKPGNILLAAPDPAPPDTPILPLRSYTPKVVDFGLAKLVSQFDERLTTSGVLPGTPAYMAPELFGGRNAQPTTAADVYALGAILYELLAGGPPFSADTPLAILELARTTDPRPLRQARPDVPRDVETVCLKCLSKQPAGRYASAGELANDLTRAVRSEPILARRATAAERLARGVRRHPVMSGLAISLMFTLTLALGVTWHLLRQARSERDRAVQHLRDSLEAVSNGVVEVVNRDEWRNADRRAFRDDTLHGFRERLRGIMEHLDPTDPRDNTMLAECDLRLSDIAYALENRDESRTHAEQAVGRYERACRDRPDDPLLRFYLLASLINQARAEDRTDERDRLADRVLICLTAIRRESADEAHEDSSVVAVFLYDVAVAADRQQDPDSVRRYLLRSTTELSRLTGGSSRVRQVRAYQASHNLQFLCQIERQCGRLDESKRAGRAAIQAATATCDEWPEHYKSWSERAGTHFEYGSTLKMAGEGDRTLEIWADGYETVGQPTIGSPKYDVFQMTHLKRNRLMLAYHLGLAYAAVGNEKEAVNWFRRALELGQHLRPNLPNDWQLRYFVGVSCVNLAEYAGVTNPGTVAADRLRLRDGIDALEQCLAERPTDHQLGSDLGYSWALYARSLCVARDLSAARSALRAALGHQWRAFVAQPDAAKSMILRSNILLYFKFTCLFCWEF